MGLGETGKVAGLQEWDGVKWSSIGHSSIGIVTCKYYCYVVTFERVVEKTLGLIRTPPRRNSKNGKKQMSCVQEILVSYDLVRGARGQVKGRTRRPHLVAPCGPTATKIEQSSHLNYLMWVSRIGSTRLLGVRLRQKPLAWEKRTLTDVPPRSWQS
jgi:hypothetical protein